MLSILSLTMKPTIDSATQDALLGRLSRDVLE